MGLGNGLSKSVYDRSSPPVVVIERTPTGVTQIDSPDANLLWPKAPPNPNPERFRIIRGDQVFGHLVVEIEYAGCTNFEGRKVLVFADITERELRREKIVDPHFSETGLSPVARFEPTERGWRLARITASAI